MACRHDRLPSRSLMASLRLARPAFFASARSALILPNWAAREAQPETDEIPGTATNEITNHSRWYLFVFIFPRGRVRRRHATYSVLAETAPSCLLAANAHETAPSCQAFIFHDCPQETAAATLIRSDATSIFKNLALFQWSPSPSSPRAHLHQVTLRSIPIRRFASSDLVGILVDYLCYPLKIPLS